MRMKNALSMSLPASAELELEDMLCTADKPLEPVRYHEFQAVDPTRRLDWRMRRAGWLVRSKREDDPRYDDAETLRAVRYLRSKRDGNTDEDFQDINTARRIHKGSQRRRLEIQARLLARQTPEQIAKRVDLPAKAIVAFEALFFHVQDRLDATDWIRKQAIKGEIFTPSREAQTDVIAKSLAYFGGVQVLELILPFLLHNAGPLAAPVQLDTAEGRTMEKARLMLLAQSLPSDARTNRRLTMGYPDFLELLKPIQKPVGRGVALELMSPLPGSLARSLRKQGANHTPPCLEAAHDAQEIVRETPALMEMA